MKKTYINPALEVVKIASQAQMLAGSPDGTGAVDPSNTVNPSLLEGHGDDFDWDD